MAGEYFPQATASINALAFERLLAHGCMGGIAVI